MKQYIQPNLPTMRIENRTYKIIARSPKTKRQLKKRVYTSTADFIKYKSALTKRWIYKWNVEHYELINREWQCIDTYPVEENPEIQYLEI